MTLEEAWKKYLLASGESLPWEPDPSALRPAFEAGWHAHREALKQSDLFPGTLSAEPVLLASEAQLVVQSPCKGKDADSTSAAGSISAEDIYAAWPVKKARGAAILAIKKAMKKEAPDKLLAAVKELAACYAQWPVAEKQYLPMCSTFMNQERWADDRTTWQKGAAATPSQFTRKYE